MRRVPALAGASHSVVLKRLPACSAKSVAVLLETLLDGAIAIRQLLSAKPRRIPRASTALLRSAGLRLRIAASQDQCGNCDQENSAHLFLHGAGSLLQDMFFDRCVRAASKSFFRQPARPDLLRVWRVGSAARRPVSLPQD